MTSDDTHAMDAELQIEKQVILVVDDTPENIDVLRGTLRNEYKIKAALNGEKALSLAFAAPHPDLILLDIMMPGMDGYEVCKALKANPSTQRIPVIFITAKTAEEDEEHGLSLGAVDYIAKPISPPIVRARVKTHLALSNQNRSLEQKVRERTEELHQTRLEIIRRLGRAAEFRDNETGLHVIRMSHYSKILAEKVCDDPQWVELLFNAAPMHDIGKIGIPDRILLKPERLNNEEWEIMKQHPLIGANIIGDHSSEILQLAKVIAITHHEKWDGSGYPAGLKGTEIPLASRIVAIADVFDALTTERPYKKAWSVEATLEHMNKLRAKHFDPELLDILPDILPAMLEIKQCYADKSRANLSETELH